MLISAGLGKNFAELPINESGENFAAQGLPINKSKNFSGLGGKLKNRRLENKLVNGKLGEIFHLVRSRG